MKKHSIPKNIEINSKELIKSSIKVQLSVLGPVGVAIDEVLFGIGDRIRSRRLELFVNELSSELKNIDENYIDKIFLTTEEFHDILIQSIGHSIRTRHIEKTKLFAKILIGSFKPNNDTVTSEDFLYIVSNLTLKDIHVLKASIDLIDELRLEKSKSSKPDEFDDFLNTTKLKNNLEIPDAEISFSLTKLAGVGLLKEYYAGNVFGSTPGGNYKETLKLNEFCKLITATNNGEHS